MAHTVIEKIVSASPQATWDAVGDFAGLQKVMPAIEAFRIDDNGDRLLTVFGSELRERLVARDDATRSITYQIVEGMPVTHHLVTITVHEDPAGARVNWYTEADPDEMLDLFTAVYTGALDELERYLTA